MPLQVRPFQFKTFSPKQLKVINWWCNPKYADKKVLFCDGAIRSGKTLIMSTSYVISTMAEYDHTNFIFGGYTISALYKNIIRKLHIILRGLGYKTHYNQKWNILVVSGYGHTNFYYCYGGSKKNSEDDVAGLTAHGCFFDEITRQQPTFVSQARKRMASFDDARTWINCNPAGPYSWTKRNYLDGNRPEIEHLLRIHFLMKDNPIISKKSIDYFSHILTGVDKQRNFYGRWVIASGLVYPNFDKKTMVKPLPPKSDISKYVVSCDYGAQNPTTFLLWGYRPKSKQWYLLKEYFYDARHSAKNKDDRQYAIDLTNWLDEWQKGLRPPIIVDPAAQDFVIMLQHFGYHVLNTNKDVLYGIQLTKMRMNQHKFVFTPNLPHTFQEIMSYIWDAKAESHGIDKVVKAHDHIPDAIRYFVVDYLYEKYSETNATLQLFKQQF